MPRKPEGWRNKRPDDPWRHSQAAKGIRTQPPHRESAEYTGAARGANEYLAVKGAYLKMDRLYDWMNRRFCRNSWNSLMGEPTWVSGEIDIEADEHKTKEVETMIRMLDGVRMEPWMHGALADAETLLTGAWGKEPKNRMLDIEKAREMVHNVILAYFDFDPPRIIED